MADEHMTKLQVRRQAQKVYLSRLEQQRELEEQLAVARLETRFAYDAMREAERNCVEPQDSQIRR